MVMGAAQRTPINKHGIGLTLVEWQSSDCALQYHDAIHRGSGFYGACDDASDSDAPGIGLVCGRVAKIALS